MEVRLLISRAAATGSQNVGDIVEVSEAEAARMIEAGQAAPVERAPKAERAVSKAKPEKAAK